MKDKICSNLATEYVDNFIILVVIKSVEHCYMLYYNKDIQNYAHNK